MALKNVNDLLEKGDDIENTLSNEQNVLSVFPRQIAEEKKKVRLYRAQPELYVQFLRLERHPYFRGQIDL